MSPDQTIQGDDRYTDPDDYRVAEEEDRFFLAGPPKDPEDDTVELLRAALERLAPEDPWQFVEITTESYQPDDECGWCYAPKPRLKRDRGVEAHDAHCPWVQARAALAATERRTNV